MVNNLDYSQTVARIRVLETKLVNQNQIERLVDAKDPKAFFEVLSDSAYASHFDITSNSSEFQKIIDAEFTSTVKFLKKNNPFSDQLDWLWLTYDILNIKFTIKNKLSGNETSTSSLSNLGNIQPEEIIKAVYVIDKVKLEDRYQEAIKKAEAVYAKTQDPKQVDLVLDQVYFKLLSDKVKKIKSKIIRDFIQSKIDLYNIALLLRLKNQEKDQKFFVLYIASEGTIAKESFSRAYNSDLQLLKSNYDFIKYEHIISLSLDYLDRYKSFLLLEKLSYDYLIDRIRYAKYEPFGPEPLVGYFMAKDNEAKLLRIIMISKINKIDSTLIHEQLRKLYLER